MGLNSFEIIFNKLDTTYCPGDTVTGQVIIDVNSPKRFQGLSIKFKGRTKTQWTKGSGKHRKTYTGLEKYFENESYLIRPPTENNASNELNPGRHTFDFTFVLPVELPSSFKEKTGNVKYAVKVVIERVWKFDNKTKKEFFVTSLIDLNKIQIVKEPATLSMEREFISCIKNGIIKARILFPCTGYICGQTVPFIFEVSNFSSVSVQWTNFKLKKYIIAYTTNKKRNNAIKEELFYKKINFKVKYGTVSSHFDTFTVPNITSLFNLEKCNLIDIEYKLKFSMIISGLHPDIDGEIPVQIGHVPLEYITPIEQLK